MFFRAQGGGATRIGGRDRRDQGWLLLLLVVVVVVLGVGVGVNVDVAVGGGGGYGYNLFLQSIYNSRPWSERGTSREKAMMSILINECAMLGDTVRTRLTEPPKKKQMSYPSRVVVFSFQVAYLEGKDGPCILYVWSVLDSCPGISQCIE